MNCKSLMIGDWVILNYEGVKKIVRIIRLHQHYADVMTENNTEIQSIAYSMLEGIPLTEEILNANGMYKDTVLYQKTEKEDAEFMACFEDGILFVDCYNNGTILRTRNIVFVHELQCALRLCELNDLVDNFKIKSM